MRFLAIVVLVVLATGCGTLTKKSVAPKPMDPLQDSSKVDDTHHGTTHVVRGIDDY
jgi:hypothetical protein